MPDDPRLRVGPYFAPETVTVGEGLGLDVFTFYFLGRGGVLGNVPAEVVTHAFGYFKPSLVEQMWDAGRAKVDPGEAAAAYFGARRTSDANASVPSGASGPFVRPPARSTTLPTPPGSPSTRRPGP